MAGRPPFGQDNAGGTSKTPPSFPPKPGTPPAPDRVAKRNVLIYKELVAFARTAAISSASGAWDGVTWTVGRRCARLAAAAAAAVAAGALCSAAAAAG